MVASTNVLEQLCFKEDKRGDLMSLTGVVGGLWKVVEGIVEEDGEKVAQGIVKTVKSTVTTVVSVVTADVVEAIHKDDDHDDGGSYS
jgi:hypothetical protein